MNHWREELNRLAVEFWCGIGDISELPSWADAANLEMGEVHPDVWDFYNISNEGDAIQVLMKIAKDVNGFSPDSLLAEPYLINAFRKVLVLFLAKRISAQKLCSLVNSLDSVFAIGFPTEVRIINQSQRKAEPANESWLGNLWNCCDWCDESWTFDNSYALVAEAKRLLAMLNSK